MKRQFNSALYQRLLLSTDKDKVYTLSSEGRGLWFHRGAAVFHALLPLGERVDWRIDSMWYPVPFSLTAKVIPTS